MSTPVPQKIDVQAIPLLSLPSLPFVERLRLPRCAAIYFVLNAAGTVLYIGQSINLAVRWVAHHRATRLIDKHATRIAWLVIDDETLLDDIESDCIAYFDPICNGYREPMPAHERVTIHVKTDRKIRDQLLGALRMKGITLQQFIDQFMQALVTHPERIEDVERWNADVPQTAKKRPGRPPRVQTRRTPTPAP